MPYEIAPAHAPYIAAITALKQERRAVILAHNYQTPEIFHGVADVRGDSLALAQAATRVDADAIIVCGVHFMAETVKVLNPDRTVIIPDARAGCSLAESITAEDVRQLRERYPGVPVVTYVNTSAAVKAESDICCTSGNAVEVVQSLGVGRVIFLPDEYLGQYVAAHTSVDLILWKGHCSVHERFSVQQIVAIRQQHPGIRVIVHPEVPWEVVQAADDSGSTEYIIKAVTNSPAGSIWAVGTEVHLVNRLANQLAPDQTVISLDRFGCLCSTMFRVSPNHLLWILEELVAGRVHNRIVVPDDQKHWTKVALDRMLAIQ